MPVTKIKIAFVSVEVLDDCDIFGSGEWYFTAFIDHNPVGDRSREFEATTGRTIILPDSWSAIVDVSTKTYGDVVGVRFSGIDKDVFGHDDLGTVTARFAYPFQEQTRIVNLRSPLMRASWPFSDYRAYSLKVRMTIEEIRGTTDLTGPSSISVSRQMDGSSTLSTVAGNPVVPRIEVCPVIPVPNNGFTKLPLRPVQPEAGVLAPGMLTPQAQPPTFTGAPLNGMVNPSVIPILEPTDPNFAKRVARLAVTFADPGNIDLNMLTWHVTSGPAVIVGRNRGGEIQVRGTGSAADTIATFEVRWDGPAGMVLATYRAWVGKVGKVPYRINLLDGTNAASQVTGLRPPAVVDSHMDVAKVIYWQAGLELVPDPVATAFDGAVASGIPGIFTVTATSNAHTRNVNPNSRPAATRYNFNPGAVNIVYIRSILGASQFGVATDIQGVPMADVSDSGTPSNSWVLPSGVPPDGGAGTVKIKTFAGLPSRVKNPGPGDKAYIKARNAANPPFVANDMNRIHAAILPAVWGGSVSNNGVNLAHEMGHVLGLMHRGNGGLNPNRLSDDQINSKDIKNKLRGHPWTENVMSYGYGGAVILAADIDLLQAAVIRRHPTVTY